MKRKIIIIDDEPLIPALMKEIIEESKEMEIAAVAGQKDEFMGLVSTGRFDAALIDISVDGQREGGLNILQTLKDKEMGIPAIILSAHNETDYALKCLQYGAKGYVCKNYICTDLVRALKEVLHGNFFISGSKGPYILNKFKAAKGSIASAL